MLMTLGKISVPPSQQVGQKSAGNSAEMGETGRAWGWRGRGRFDHSKYKYFDPTYSYIAGKKVN
jgi:hypothetical protein